MCRNRRCKVCWSFLWYDRETKKEEDNCGSLDFFRLSFDFITPLFWRCSTGVCMCMCLAWRGRRLNGPLELWLRQVTNCFASCPGHVIFVLSFLNDQEFLFFKFWKLLLCVAKLLGKTRSWFSLQNSVSWLRLYYTLFLGSLLAKYGPGLNIEWMGKSEAWSRSKSVRMYISHFLWWSTSGSILTGKKQVCEWCAGDCIERT